MLLKVPVSQLVTYWPLIKKGVASADQIPESRMQAAFNDLLADLLHGNLQALLVVAPDRMINGIMIVEFTLNKQNENKTMSIKTLYAIRHTDDDTWGVAMTELVGIAKGEKCDSIKAMTANPKVVSIAGRCGFQEEAKILSYKL
jgi:hypothetical protein